MDPPDYDRYTHRRYNPFTGEWVLVSPHRALPPWGGQKEPPDIDKVPDYKSDCYLCPTNLRGYGKRNPDYQGTFFFANDYGFLLPSERVTAEKNKADLLKVEPESGICRVICYSASHTLTISRMNQSQEISIIAAWMKEYQHLGNKAEINNVQTFENRGQIMGW